MGFTCGRIYDCTTEVSLLELCNSQPIRTKPNTCEYLESIRVALSFISNTERLDQLQVKLQAL